MSIDANAISDVSSLVVLGRELKQTSSAFGRSRSQFNNGRATDLDLDLSWNFALDQARQRPDALAVLSRALVFDRLAVEITAGVTHSPDAHETLSRLEDCYVRRVFPEETYRWAMEKVSEIRGKLPEEAKPWLRDAQAVEGSASVEWDGHEKDRVDKLREHPVSAHHDSAWSRVAASGQTVERLLLYFAVGRHLKKPMVMSPGRQDLTPSLLTHLGGRPESTAVLLAKVQDRIVEAAANAAGSPSFAWSLDRYDAALVGRFPLLAEMIVSRSKKTGDSLVESTLALRSLPGAKAFRTWFAELTDAAVRGDRALLGRAYRQLTEVLEAWVRTGHLNEHASYRWWAPAKVFAVVPLVGNFAEVLAADLRVPDPMIGGDNHLLFVGELFREAIAQGAK